MNPHPLLRERTAGVILHPTSLPSRRGAFGIGDLGYTARRFVDWMRAAGLSRWQMLPIGPVGAGDSPYSSLSSFAIEPMLVSIADLVDEGLLPTAALRNTATTTRDDDRGRASWRRVRAWKTPRIEAAFRKFASRRGRRGSGGRDHVEFQDRNAFWLDDWCRFAALDARRRRCAGPVQRTFEYHAFVQFILDRQWSSLRHHALENGIRLIGDLPIFCGADGADVAARPGLFRLGRDGAPSVLTGCPPDAFTRDGQLWGHPHYRWSTHQRDDFRWWRSRVETTLDRFDLLRIDHFIGFVRAYEIPGAARNARQGRWGRTPGRKILERLRKDVGPLPFIAEDLGEVTPSVHRLRDDFGLPGMRILQWAFHDENGRSKDLPHRHPHRAAVYPGTHDNDTVAGWYRSLNRGSRRRFIAYAGEGAEVDPARTMVRLALTSPADTAIVQMQDILGLGRGSRMNVPGKPNGNWTWRLRRGDLSIPKARRWSELVTASGRGTS